MLHFHSFWTAPQHADPRASPTDELRLDDFEALTWLASALAARRHGPVRLYTDSSGADFVRRVKLDGVYDGGVSTALDAVPAEIDPLLFWTAGKIFAWSLVDEPAVQMDPDAILWGTLPAAPGIHALHEENLAWRDYSKNRERYGSFGFDDDGWDWNVAPLNTGIAVFRDSAQARDYAAESLAFMRRFSTAARQEAFWGLSRERGFFDAALFAEQRLLSMLARRHGWEVGTLGALLPTTAHLAPNPLCCHLWHTKTFYTECRAARAAYVNHLSERLRALHPESHEILAAWGLDQPITEDRYPQDLPVMFPVVIRPTFVLLGRVAGVLHIQDSNLGCLRPGLPGGRVGLAESLHPAPGTSYELIEIRHQPAAGAAN